MNCIYAYYVLHPNTLHRASSLLFGTLPSPVNITSTALLLTLLDVVIQTAEQPPSSSLISRGYEKQPISSNDGAGGDSVYIWTFVSRSNATVGAAAAITGVSLASTDAERAAAAAAGYTQLPGDLNSGTGGAVVTLHIIRSSGSVAAGTQSSIESAAAARALFGLVVSRTAPANSTLIAGDLNHGVVGAAPLYLYALTAPSTLTSVAITWKPCTCSIGTQFICLAGIAASTSNSSAAASYTTPLCARVTVLPPLAANWSTTSSKSRKCSPPA